MIGLFAWLRKKRLTADPMIEQKWLFLQSKLMVDARLFCFSWCHHSVNKVTETRCEVANISNNTSRRIR